MSKREKNIARGFMILGFVLGFAQGWLVHELLT